MAAFFTDECVAGLIVEGLRRAGFEITDAREACLGESDDRALALASAAGRVVVTEDWGFGEMVMRRGEPAIGVVILSLFKLPAGSREAYAVERIIEIADKAEGHVVVIEPGRIRFRRFPSF